MKNDLRLFPYLTEDLRSKLRFQVTKYSFFYETDDEEKELVESSLESGSAVSVIKDEKGLWTPDEYNLCFRRKYSLRTFKHLFGPAGIVCDNAQIGIAVVWTSSDSKQRGVVKVGVFKKEDNDVNVEVEKAFSRGQLRGKIDLTTELYIAEAGTPKKTEKHLANENGYVLGVLDKQTIVIDGSGTTFPVFEVYEKDQPLWYVNCDWDDPTIDSFVDTVSININTAHKNYKYLDRTKSSFNSQLLAETMAGAISVIIEEVRRQPESWEQIISNNDYEPGSVGAAIYYFMEALEWDLSSPRSVSLSARKFFDQRM